MKKSLMSRSMLLLATTGAALAASRSPNSGATILVSPDPGNDEKQGSIAPIVTLEMLAGTQPKLKPGTQRRPHGSIIKRAPAPGLRLGKKPFADGRDLPTSMMAHVPQVTTSRMANSLHVTAAAA